MTTFAGVDGMEKALGLAKRNVALLACAQAFLGAAPPIAFSFGALAAHDVLLGADKSLSTAPLTGFNIGVSTGAVLVSLFSRLIGRRLSFMIGASCTAAGGLVAAIALFRSDFWLFTLGLLITGISSGFAQKIRFAAADASPSFYKGAAISWILAGGVISALFGPPIATVLKDIFSPIAFAGAFVTFVGFGLFAIVFLYFLKLPDVATKNSQDTGPARSLGEIVLTRRFATGMFCGISTYALMTFMMTGAPLAMVVGCGLPQDLSSKGIQLHVLAMFAPSFFTGKLVSRFGAEKIVAAGLVIMMLCAAIAHMGVELWNFWGALILLGAGWNFGFIGATAIVASSYKPSEADKVQGFHDIVLFTTVALASFASGLIFNKFGWDAMIMPVWPLAMTGLLLLVFLKRPTPPVTKA
jgi:MFS family permease